MQCTVQWLAELCERENCSYPDTSSLVSIRGAHTHARPIGRAQLRGCHAQQLLCRMEAYAVETSCCAYMLEFLLAVFGHFREANYILCSW